jgi:hypothetical protein
MSLPQMADFVIPSEAKDLAPLGASRFFALLRMTVSRSMAPRHSPQKNAPIAARRGRLGRFNASKAS